MLRHGGGLDYEHCVLTIAALARWWYLARWTCHYPGDKKVNLSLSSGQKGHLLIIGDKRSTYYYLPTSRHSPSKYVSPTKCQFSHSTPISEISLTRFFLHKMVSVSVGLDQKTCKSVISLLIYPLDRIWKNYVFSFRIYWTGWDKLSPPKVWSQKVFWSVCSGCTLKKTQINDPKSRMTKI